MRANDIFVKSTDSHKRASSLTQYGPDEVVKYLLQWLWQSGLKYRLGEAGLYHAGVSVSSCYGLSEGETNGRERSGIS